MMVYLITVLIINDDDDNDNNGNSLIIISFSTCVAKQPVALKEREEVMNECININTDRQSE